MPFVDVNLSDIQLEKPEVPVGTYTFSLAPGSSYRESRFQRDAQGNPIQELNVRFVVAEGDHKGKGVFVTYADPSSTTKNGKSNQWTAQALKKLEITLGVDSLPGEDPATYLNRVASNGGGRITATLIPNNYTKDGVLVEGAPKFSVFSVKPAA